MSGGSRRTKDSPLKRSGMELKPGMRNFLIQMKQVKENDIKSENGKEASLDQKNKEKGVHPVVTRGKISGITKGKLMNDDKIDPEKMTADKSNTDNTTEASTNQKVKETGIKKGLVTGEKTLHSTEAEPLGGDQTKPTEVKITPTASMGMKNLLLRMRQLKESQASTESTPENQQVNQPSGSNSQPETRSWVAKKNNAFWKALALNSFQSMMKPRTEDKTKAEETIVKTKMALRPVSVEKDTPLRSKQESIDYAYTISNDEDKNEEIHSAKEKEELENEEEDDNEGGDKKEGYDQDQEEDNLVEDKKEEEVNDEVVDNNMAVHNGKKEENNENSQNDDAEEIDEEEGTVERTIEETAVIEEVKFDETSTDEPQDRENNVGRVTPSEDSYDQLDIDLEENLLTLSMISAEYRDIPDIVKFQWHHDGTLTDIDRDFISKGKTFHARKARRHRLRRWQEDMAQSELIAVLEAMCNNHVLMDKKSKRFMRTHGVIVPSDDAEYLQYLLIK